MMGCSQGALSNLLVEAGSPVYVFDNSSEIYDFLEEDLIKRGNLVGGKGIAGTRSNFANRIREGSYEIAGKISTYTCAADLDNWLPRILGAAETPTDTFDVSDGLPTFGVMLNRVAGTFLYSNCYINRALWRGMAGPGDAEPELVEQILEIHALGEDATVTYPVTPPTLSTTANRRPYIVADATLSIGGISYQMHDFLILVDNHLQSRWVNSLTPTALCPQDRTVMLRATFPFTSVSDAVNSGIYQHASRHTGVSAVVTMRPSGSAYGSTFTFTSLQWAQVSPQVRGKREIVLEVDFVARKTGTTSELVVVNDNTT